MNKFVATIAADAMMTFALAGYGNGEPAKPEVPDRSVSSSAKIKSSTSPKPTEESTTPTESKIPTEAPAITQVNDADYTPADGPNTRLFQLEDSTTRCFPNDLSSDACLVCQVNFVNPPMADDGTGNKVLANTVSWDPRRVTYKVLTFPSADEMRTLPASSQLSIFGYSCATYGSSTLECSGPAGATTINNDNATSTQMPKEDAPPAADGQLGGQENDAPNDLAQQGEPDNSPASDGLSDLGASIPGLDRQLPAQSVTVANRWYG